MSDGGKGSKPRPFSVSHEEWSSRWDAIFGRDTVKDQQSLDKNDNQPDNHMDQKPNFQH